MRFASQQGKARESVQERVRETRNKKEMDCVTMVLVERETGLPLHLVVLINSFLYERLTEENFKQAIALWFENKEECNFDSVTSASGRPQESRIWRDHIIIEEISTKTLANGMSAG
jgi:hypothetical protein